MLSSDTSRQSFDSCTFIQTQPVPAYAKCKLCGANVLLAHSALMDSLIVLDDGTTATGTHYLVGDTAYIVELQGCAPLLALGKYTNHLATCQERKKLQESKNEQVD